MLENVKKCKNFLAMLIKLACSGSQSPEMGQNVKKLVEQLLVSSNYKSSVRIHTTGFKGGINIYF